MAEHETGRKQLLDAIDARRRGIERYLAEKRPASNRLTTISVVSSCLAAALAAGPAVGGDSFARTVQDGLALSQSQVVWRLLCLAAVAASLTAAIAANLSKSNDLTARIAAVEAANSLLDALQARLRFGRLGLGDGAQQYQEIIARIPWISEAGPSSPEDPERPAAADRVRGFVTRAGPYLVMTTAITAVIAVVAVAGMVVGLARSGSAPPLAAPTAAPAASPAVPAPETTPAAVPVARAVYSGDVAGTATSLAVVIDGDRAVAYLCDGRKLEAWLEGTVADGRISLTGRNEASLTGAIREAGLAGSGTAAGIPITFSLPTAGAPAGVYEARATADGVEVRLGWAVLADGTSVGVQNRAGERSPAPPLTLPDATFELDGQVHRAVLLGGAADVIPGN
jgi:hypothetical protein